MHKFKDSLKPLGVLFGTFSTREQLTQLLRIHLSRITQKWEADAHGKPDLRLTSRIDGEVRGNSVENDDFGFIDHLENGVEEFKRATSSLETIGVISSDIGEAMHVRTEEMEKATANTNDPQLHVTKRIIKLAAEDFNNYSSRMEAEIPIFSESYKRGLSSFVSAVNLSMEDFKPTVEEIESARHHLISHRNALINAISKVERFRDVTDQLPRVHSVFNKAKRRVVEVTDRFSQELNFTLSSNAECVRLLDDVLCKLRNSTQQ